MAASCASSPIKSHTSFDDLQKGFNGKNVLARIIHYWEARNAKKGGLLMGFELLLIDEKENVIQAFIPANRVGYYQPNLKADTVYNINNFLVIDNKTSYRLSAHKFLIQFTPKTVLDKSDQHDHIIERQTFRIRSYDELKKIVDKNEDLYDIIGKVVLIDNEKNFNGVAKNKVEVHLQLKELGESGNNSIITSEITKLETVTISELYQFLKNETPQIVGFYCIATVVDILLQYGWKYIACTKCNCKLGRTDTALVCKTCNYENTVGLIR
ncbi:unnamed protein product [Thlaspi arvense]|uniref:Replication protein A 70 kDa DNA-binding subunit B/D first OB fold domain-containing protein n=1 Tax=Thlaspi arvense TaxID=13288 RepID=A0AAU9RUR5_THLAR|nr:unnamed protein product [Thlaspi arvense]